MAVEAARVGPRAERAWGAALLVGAGVAGASVLSLATAGLSMALAVAGVGLALFLGVVLADYRVGVLALPFAILLSPDLGGGSLVHLRITDLLLPVVLAGWMLRRVAVGEPLVRTPVNGLVMVLLVAGLVSTSLGVLRGTIHPLSLGAVFLLSRVEYLLIFFLAVQAARSLPWGRRLAGALLWGFAVTAAVGLYQHAAFGPQYIVSGVRANERATFAAVLVFLLMMAAGMAVTLRAWWQRLALCALALAAAVPLLYTYSRGAYVALAAGLLFLGLRRSRGVRWSSRSSSSSPRSSCRSRSGAGSPPSPWSWALRSRPTSPGPPASERGAWWGTRSSPTPSWGTGWGPSRSGGSTTSSSRRPTTGGSWVSPCTRRSSGGSGGRPRGSPTGHRSCGRGPWLGGSSRGTWRSWSRA